MSLARVLARIDDLLSEVQTKVRSLARQRGKARRFIEMRERKLALELALAQAELGRLRQRHLEIDSDLRALAEARVQDAAQLRSAEAEHEALRTRLPDMERQRAEKALIAYQEKMAKKGIAIDEHGVVRSTSPQLSTFGEDFLECVIGSL